MSIALPAAASAAADSPAYVVSAQQREDHPAGGLTADPLGARLLLAVDVSRGAAADVHAVTVRPGDTLSGISQEACGTPGDWTGIWQQDRGEIGSDPDLIRPGQVLRFTCEEIARLAALDVHSPPVSQPVPDPAPAAVSSGTVGTAGMGAFEACVIARESGGNAQVMNATGHYGLYQFSASTWAEYGGNPADFGHASAAEQEQVFANAMAQGGEFNWAPYDGC